jgi:branched-chain amino acid transport system ATP-binding protein
MSLLHIHGLTKSFGGLLAVDNCSFDIEEGKIVSLIGPNGAGKTTVFNLISGIMKPTHGRIVFAGKEIQGQAPHRITRQGLSRTYQISRVLDDLTVLENMLVHAPVNGVQRWFQPLATAAERRRALEHLEFVGIARLVDEKARTLSYGQKKLLDFAAQLMAQPRLILLDEPAGGVNPVLLETIVARIRDLNKQGITFLIVEHNMDLVMNISDNVVVMAYGEVLASGKPAEVQQLPEVLEAYIGRRTS